MRFASKHLLILGLVMIFCEAAQAQQQINPVTQIRWPLITGAGTPAATGAVCSATHYGQPYQDISVTPNVAYTCGTDGWAVRGGAVSSGVSSINGSTGAFTFTGAGVSCAANTCTFLGGGGTIPSTTNLLAGNGSGGAADSGIVPANVPNVNATNTWPETQTFSAASGFGAVITNAKVNGELQFFAPAVTPTFTMSANNLGLVMEGDEGTAITSNALSPATSSLNRNAPAYVFTSNYWVGSASEPDSWFISPVLGTAATSTPTSTLTFLHTGSSGAATVEIPDLTSNHSPVCTFALGCSEPGSPPANTNPDGTVIVTYWPYLQASKLTTLTGYGASGPNGQDGTFSAGANAPSWDLSGSVINFTPNTANGQSINLPLGILSTAKTLTLWMRMMGPPTNGSGVKGRETFISDSGLATIAQFASGNGTIGVFNGSTENAQSTDRYVGLTSFSITIPSGGGAPTVYKDGKVADAMLVDNTFAFTAGSTSPAMIGDIPGFSGNGFGGTFGLVGVEIDSSPLTAAQIAQMDASVKSAITAATGLHWQGNAPPERWLFDGDSNQCALGVNFDYTTSAAYRAAVMNGDTQYNNNCLSGQLQTTNINPNVTSRIFPKLLSNSGGPVVISDNAGINDMSANVTAATLLTTYGSQYCSPIKAKFAGTMIVIPTLPPHTAYTAGQETQRETYNTNAIAAETAGTLGGCDAVANVGEAPILALAISPNYLQPTGAGAFDPAISPDGIHFLAAGYAIHGQIQGLTMLDVQGRLNTPTWISEPIPFNLFKFAGNYSGASTVMNVITLKKGWQVCGMASNVSTAFAGTGITAMTMTVGDSTGTATQYLPSQSMLTATKALNQVPNFLSTNGIVQATFTTTGGNLSAMTAGQLNLDICIIHNP